VSIHFRAAGGSVDEVVEVDDEVVDEEVVEVDDEVVDEEVVVDDDVVDEVVDDEVVDEGVVDDDVVVAPMVVVVVGGRVDDVVIWADAGMTASVTSPAASPKATTNRTPDVPVTRFVMCSRRSAFHVRADRIRVPVPDRDPRIRWCR